MEGGHLRTNPLTTRSRRVRELAARERIADGVGELGDVLQRSRMSAHGATLAVRLGWLARKAKNDPHRLQYMDQALTPLINETENLELYKTRSSQAFLDHRRHVQEAQKVKVAPSS